MRVCAKEKHPHSEKGVKGIDYRKKSGRSDDTKPIIASRPELGLRETDLQSPRLRFALK